MTDKQAKILIEKSVRKFFDTSFTDKLMGEGWKKKNLKQAIDEGTLAGGLIEFICQQLDKN